MNSTTIVAAVQFAPKVLDVESNLAVAQQLSFEAAAKGAKVIVLPELAISGQALSNVTEASFVCQTKDGYQTQALAEISRNYNCHIIFGYVELNESKLYNSAVCVGPRGTVEGNWRKHNLWGPDLNWAKSADNLNICVNTPAGRLGALICRDVMNQYRESYAFFDPEQRFYKKGSVDTIALLTNWGAEFGFPDSSWVELSEATGANIIVSNRVGSDRDLRFKGGSCVISKDMQVQSYGSSFSEACVVGGLVLL